MVKSGGPAAARPRRWYSSEFLRRIFLRRIPVGGAGGGAGAVRGDGSISIGDYAVCVSTVGPARARAMAR